jgi:hypothetical protein
MVRWIKCLGAGCFVAIALAGAAPAGATTIGQLAPGNSPTLCFAQSDFFNSSVTKGESYAVPSYATSITSWSTNAGAGPGQTMSFKVFRQVGTDTFRVVAHDGPRALAESTTNRFPVNIAVQPGDFIGINSANAASVNNACVFTDPDFVSPTDRYRGHIGDPADGEENTYFQSGSVAHVNVTAVVKPINAFTLGVLTRNKKKGTAAISVEVPAPGELTLSGKGVKAAANARSSAAVAAPGTATLTIKAKGKTAKKLAQTGKATIKATIKYTPSDGDPNAQTRKVTLRRKR